MVWVYMICTLLVWRKAKKVDLKRGLFSVNAGSPSGCTIPDKAAITSPWFHVILSTGLTIGLWFPFGPGTAGAFVALLIWIGLYFILSPVALCIATIALIVVTLIVGAWTDQVMVIHRQWGCGVGQKGTLIGFPFRELC